MDVGDEIVGDGIAVEVLIDGVVDTTTEIRGLLDLSEGFFDDAVGEVIVGLTFGAIEAHGGMRDLAHLPLVELRLGEYSEDRGDAGKQLEATGVSQCGGPEAAAPNSGQAVARSAVGFIPVRGLGLVFF